MKKALPLKGIFLLTLFFSLFFNNNALYAQCANADFSDGNFTGWTGTYSVDQCTGLFLFGSCAGCANTNPTNSVGFTQGPNNDPPSDANNQYCQIITTTAGGNDPNILALSGGVLPLVWPGGSGFSARIGNMWQKVESGNTGDGETISYTFLVTPSNLNFTYHYAVVLNDGGHGPGEQPYFNIQMVDGGGNQITCAAYEVDATTIQAIGGVNAIPAAAVYWKPWTSVLIPLNAYIGQTVTITFTTRSCLPGGCAGSHYAYAYISAECGPQTLVASSPSVCGGQNVTLTAPGGLATYSWSGPGIVSGGNSQIVTINKPGPYSVTMTTLTSNGTPGCTFTLDTTIAANPSNPSAIFSADTVCVGNATHFTDLSTPSPGVNAWAWDFTNSGVYIPGAQNPTYTFPAAGTYPVKLQVTWPPCQADTVINVVVSPLPTSTFTVTSPVCEGSNSIITYTGNAPPPPSDTYNWNFNGGTIASGTGQGPYQVNWSTGGTKNVTLTVTAGSCTSPLSTQQVVVNPFPGVTVTPNTSICTGGSTTLTASGATTYAWSPATGLSGTTGATVTANPTSTTTSTVTGTSATCTSPASVTVTVNPIPTSTFTAPGPVCVGQSLTVTYTGTATGAATYNWNFGGGTAIPTTGQGPFQVSWNASGTMTITLTVTENGCTSPLTSVTVLVNPGPTSQFTATSPVCVGSNSNIIYTGTGTGAATYTWNFGGGTIVSGAGQGPYQVSWNTTGTQTLTLSVTENGCSSPLTTVPVLVTPVPTSAFNATSICTGQNSTVTYAGNAPSTATYNWNFGGGNVISGSGQGPYQVTWGTAGPENITLSVSEGACVSTLTTVPITVSLTPTSTFTAPGPLCAGQSTTVTYTGNDAASNTAVFNWNFPGGTVVSGSGVGPYLVSWANADTSNVTLTVTDNGCSSPPDTVQVIVYQIPTSNFTASTPVCTGQNSTITYTGNASPAASYTWGFAGGTSTGNGQGPYQVNWPTPGTENITLSVTENGCNSITTTVPVTVNLTPNSPFTVTTPECTSQNSTITYTGNDAASNTAVFNWGFDGGTTASGTGVGPYQINWAAAGVKNVSLTVTDLNCVSPPDTIPVTVYAIPTSLFTVVSPVCTGVNSTVTYNGTGTGAATYTWGFSGGTSTGNGQGPYQVNWATAGVDSVSLTVTENGCTSPVTTLPVNVNAIPVSNAGPDVQFCSGLSAALGTASTNGYNYLWSPGTGLSSTTVSNPTANPTNSANSVAVINYVVTTSNANDANCVTTDTVAVTVYPVPVAVFAHPAGECFTGNSFNLVASGTFLPTATFAWTFGPNGVPATSTSQNQGVSFSAPGGQPVTLTITQDGCVSNTATDSIFVYPMPYVNFPPDLLIGCENFEVCFTNNSVSTLPSTYFWTFGDGAVSFQENPCHTYGPPGVYTVGLKVTSADGCVGDTAIIDKVTVIADPVAIFSASPPTIQLPENTINLLNHSQHAVSYLWEMGIFGTSTVENPQLTFTDSGTYNITLLAYNQLGCVDSTQQDLVVLPPVNFFIPNVFTPNGDGNNDEFYIFSQAGVRVLEFEIFDRWGEKVHEGNYPWDGTYQGKPAPPAVYVYVFKLGLAGDNVSIMRRGSVTLIR